MSVYKESGQRKKWLSLCYLRRDKIENIGVNQRKTTNQKIVCITTFVYMSMKDGRPWHPIKHHQKKQFLR